MKKATIKIRIFSGIKFFFLFFFEILRSVFFFFVELGRRVAAFGYHAGFAGAALGIDVWSQQILHPKQKYPSVGFYPAEDKLISHVKDRLKDASK